MTFLAGFLGGFLAGFFGGFFAGFLGGFFGTAAGFLALGLTDLAGAFCGFLSLALRGLLSLGGGNGLTRSFGALGAFLKRPKASRKGFLVFVFVAGVFVFFSGDR